MHFKRAYATCTERYARYYICYGRLRGSLQGLEVKLTYIYIWDLIWFIMSDKIDEDAHLLYNILMIDYRMESYIFYVAFL